MDACLRLAHHYYSSFKASSHGEGITCLGSAKEFFAKAADQGSGEGSLWLARCELLAPLHQRDLNRALRLLVQAESTGVQVL